MNSGKEIRQKIRDAIKAKLVELGSYVDDELPDYIMVMLANKRTQDQMTQDLELFLNNNATVFTNWLFELLKKLDQKPEKIEKKKKKKDKSSKPKSQKVEASSLQQKIKLEPNDKLPTEPTPSPPPGQQEPKLPEESSVPFISILLDTNDTLDKELTKEIDEDRKKLKEAKTSSSEPPLETNRKSAGPSYREHVIKQRSSKSESQISKQSNPKPHSRPQKSVAESSTPQRSASDVKLRLGERLVEEVLVPVTSRKRKTPSSFVAQVIHHDIEEDSDEEGPSASKKLASLIRANRRPTLPASRQANTSLLKKAVSEATASTTIIREKPPIIPGPVSRPSLVKISRPQHTALPSAHAKYIPQMKPQSRAASSSSITSSTSTEHGIQSRSLQREMSDRDFDSHTFQTIDSRQEIEANAEEFPKQELVENAATTNPEGVYVYKNVVAVVGGSRQTTDETQLELESDEEVTEEEVAAVVQGEADSRHIYVAENVSIADSTQSPEHQLEEEYEETQPSEDEYQVVEPVGKPPERSSTVSSSPRFIVTLEGAKRHLKLSANQRRKNQKKTVKRGFVQSQTHQEDVIIVKQPRRTISPEMPRQFVFTHHTSPEEIIRPLVEEDETMVTPEEPFLVYPAAPTVEPLTISMKDSDDEDEGYEAEEPPQEENTSKSNERCKFWPACKNGDSCPFIHPTTPCRTFPHCKFGDKCLYIHPNCRFDSHCTNPSCPYTHATRKSVPPVILHVGAPPSISHPPRHAIQTACKFHPLCKNPQCTFLHPKACHFGSNCTHQGCKFFHPKVVVGRSSMTWTKEEKHISQRPFAAATTTAQVSKAPALSLKPFLASSATSSK